MGGGIALQAAAVEPRISAVAAEAPFSSFREASYDYAGFHWNPWIGRIFFGPSWKQACWPRNTSRDSTHLMFRLIDP